MWCFRWHFYQFIYGVARGLRTNVGDLPVRRHAFAPGRRTRADGTHYQHVTQRPEAFAARRRRRRRHVVSVCRSPPLPTLVSRATPGEASCTRIVEAVLASGEASSEQRQQRRTLPSRTPAAAPPRSGTRCGAGVERGASSPRGRARRRAHAASTAPPAMPAPCRRRRSRRPAR